MNAQIQQTEQTLAHHVAGFAPDNWVRFVANVELDEDCVDSIGLFIVQDGSELRKVDVGDPTHGRRYHGLLDPIRAVWQAYNQEWKVADLVVDFTGNYSIYYSYEYRRLADPMVLTGVAVLKDYISRHATVIPRR